VTGSPVATLSPRSLLDAILDQPRPTRAHSLGDDLLVECLLPVGPDRRLVPHVLHLCEEDGEWELTGAHAGATNVAIVGADEYLYLSKETHPEVAARGHGGASLWRSLRGRPVLVASAPGGIEAYASLADSRVVALTRPPAGGPIVLRGAAASATRARQGTAPLSLVAFTPDGPPVACSLDLADSEEFTGEVAAGRDGTTVVAGVVRHGPTGDRRFGLLILGADLAVRHRLFATYDLTTPQPSPAPDGRFACVGEEVARPGSPPVQWPVVVDGFTGAVRQVPSDGEVWLRPAGWLDGDTLLCLGEHAGRRRLWRVGTSDGRRAQMAFSGSVTAASVREPGDGRQVVAVISSAVDQPPVVSLVCNDRPGPARSPFVAAEPLELPGRIERITTTGRAGGRWPAWLCRPTEPAETGPSPLLVWCHGGPVGAWTDWSWRWNPWPFVTAGFAVLLPDPPLSLGLGSAALAQGWGRWRTEVAAVAADQVAATLARPEIDETRLAVMGASFGGYLALALASLLPAVRLVVSHAGFTDLRAVASSSDVAWHWRREYGDPDTAPAYEEESLAMTGIGPDTTVLLSHGLLDDLVPASGTVTLHRRFTTRGARCELLLLPDEGHAIRRPANVTAWFDWVLDASRRTLAPPAATVEEAVR
jgi:dipeptidyl aminopeptidase/acylaminoacyl peptidase